MTGADTRWEYKIIRTADGGLFSGDTAPMEDALNSLGDEQWELVDTISDSRPAGAGTGQTALVFKRPKK
ncbi:DUF4177 domain-containing protein [Haloferax mediterranei ATCC 33500]|uniref:DUF4177 domain-containing protein n=1 Tax=Haloferax mediterranei (strain ATCC 33500 / DSM 1411 / JCM 8866 / NBRC 14739 / NCIMB 2177 / R-4) TaxID=523841 RepID=I3R8M5_HALMT|nr:DUF4177 domain-containing protein [Haloferax mediterranei]AFK20585.1 hypothetical protein HFX_2915 [Haloferax mediterranei ATCC 33500]AHZ23941.1 hypothetical protein BM92_15375 [Haloferax mediterranei ATCC 33500]ELZ98368.1 hypothetical protein C439_16325 [Haloferax mediterranei ATCC 33500]MDX5986659.1 DUF4177 domain-containing protein [Haloferax mediterranei ATCC 33500]QCQ75991.1 DUF4177 domain-containing protein [Haloferax mediterranei ATCC 33500]